MKDSHWDLCGVAYARLMIRSQMFMHIFYLKDQEISYNLYLLFLSVQLKEWNNVNGDLSYLI